MFSERPGDGQTSGSAGLKETWLTGKLVLEQLVELVDHGGFFFFLLGGSLDPLPIEFISYLINMIHRVPVLLIICVLNFCCDFMISMQMF